MLGLSQPHYYCYYYYYYYYYRQSAEHRRKDFAAAAAAAAADADADAAAAAGAKSTLLRVQLPPEAHGQRLQGRSVLVVAPPEMLLSELMLLVCREPQQ